MSDYGVDPGATIERLIAERDAALGREAAFKETLERWIDLDKSRDARYDAIQQRLTAADERVDVLEGLLNLSLGHIGDAVFSRDIDATLKPAEGGVDE